MEPHTIQFRSVDFAGNIETAKSIAVRVDATPPLTKFVLNEDQVAVSSNGAQIIGPKAISIQADDPIVNNVASGIREIGIKLDNTIFSVNASSFTPLFSTSGIHFIEAFSKDNVGHVGALISTTVFVDAESPRIFVSSLIGGAVFKATTKIRDQIKIDFSVMDNFDPAPSSVAFLTLINPTTPFVFTVADGELIDSLTIPEGFWRLTVNTADFVRNFSSTVTASFKVVHDTIAPAAAAFLPLSETNVSEVVLRWFATGDDALIGTAARYDLRFSNKAINTESDFSNATRIEQVQAPKVPGSLETFTFSEISPDTPYFFALKVIDDQGNESEMSNVVSLFLLSSNVKDRDHNGTDWIIASDTNIAGTHSNVGLFMINSGITVRVEPYNGIQFGAIEVRARSINVSGTLTATGSGFRGGPMDTPAECQAELLGKGQVEEDLSQVVEEEVVAAVVGE